MEDVKEKNIKKITLKDIGQAVTGIIIGLGCALGQLPYGLMPLGISVCCIRGIPIYSIFGIYIGAVIGGITVINQPIYVAAVILTVPLTVISNSLFRRKKALQSSIIAFITLTFYYIFVWVQYGMLTFDLIEGIAGIITGTTFVKIAERAVFQIVNRNLQREETTSVVILIAVMLTAISGFNISGIAPARILAVIILLFLAQFTKSSIVGLWGLIIGLAFCLQDTDRLYLAVCYAAGITVYSNIAISQKSIRISVFSALFALCAVYCNADNITLAYVCETALGAAIFLLIPEKIILKISERLSYNRAENDEKLKKLIYRKLFSAGKAMNGIAAAINCNEGVKMDIYDRLNRSADEICRKCRKTAVCWGENYGDTQDVINKAADKIRSCGSYKEEYLPEFFIERCGNHKKIVEKFSNDAEKYNYEMANEGFKQANRQLIAGQYEEIGSYIKNICDEISAISFSEEQLVKRIREYFGGLGYIFSAPTVYKDSTGGLTVEVGVKSPKKLYEGRIAAELSGLIDKQLSCKEMKIKDDRYYIKLTETEKFKLDISHINKNKNGETVCGDSFITFTSNNNKKILALSDGMGSGEEAGRVSTLSLEIVKNLVENGFSEERSCNLVNSTLMLGGRGQSSATIDLISINPFNGKTDFYKLGASPTLIIRENKAYEIVCRSLPAGIMENIKADHKNCKLKSNDTIIMFSDGINIDESIINLCVRNSNELPIVLCEKIMDTVSGDAPADDITVAAVKITEK